MSAIKKMNQELETILGREPTIHEQVDILILTAIKERVHELQLMYQIEPNDEYREQYEQAVRCMKQVQERNPKIFGGIDSDGGDYE
tara:strand:+ start:291 stop:548 length:258 start_codon:yes stop_codon:yes gene_type:complete